MSISFAEQVDDGNESDSTFEGFNEGDLEDLNDTGKLVSMMKTLVMGNTKLLAGQKKMKSDLSRIQQDNVELRQELNSLKTAHQKLRTDTDKTRGDLTKTQKTVKDIDTLVKTHDTVLKRQGEAIQRLEESKDETAEPPKRFPYSKTVVAMNLFISDEEWFDDNEDTQRKAELIIHKHLGLPGIPVVRTLRKGANDNYVGIVKIELGSEQEVETVLQNAKKLAEHPDPSVSRIYIRPSKPDIERMNDRSWNAVLDVVDPNRSSLFVHPRWGGVRKTRGGNRGGRGRGGGQGRGRGRGARSARGRGRGGSQQQSGIDYDNAWSPSLAPGGGRGGGGPYGLLHRSGSNGSLASQARATSVPGIDTPSNPPFSTFTNNSRVHTRQMSVNSSSAVSNTANKTAATGHQPQPHVSQRPQGPVNTQQGSQANVSGATNQAPQQTNVSGQPS